MATQEYDSIADANSVVDPIWKWLSAEDLPPLVERDTVRVDAPTVRLLGGCRRDQETSRRQLDVLRELRFSKLKAPPKPTIF